MVTSAGAYWKKSAEAEGSMECTVLQLSQATAPEKGRRARRAGSPARFCGVLLHAFTTAGSVVAQGCHAAVAAVWAHRDHPDRFLCLRCRQMVTLEVKGEIQLKNLAEKLEAAGVGHKLWIEQPENIPTCIATAPCPKSQVASFFRKLKLCK
ncbi:putative peptidyl-tRNA hydrolase PTRHD1 [Hordeum vulgare subsp. vulgare]|uniref:putative peptidyl-tRNA hydrolase PTRHD1 n=1 Tax=Hordeum vulgare subsp. vulgare TaxID=112509 RepID=UPI001D1A5AB7|nr:putative peptidyl-tRNA hydrolase PTRHD1 [Hordeum vulgare subsp. vulgare]